MRYIPTLVKQSTDIVGHDEIHSSAQIGEEGRIAIPSRTVWLNEWQEARGILNHIDINKGSITFEGFIVRIPPSLLADLPSLYPLIGQDVSLLRTDSAHCIHISARARATIRADKPDQTTPHTFVAAQERTETNKTRTELKEDA